ncbi:MAG: hypothetical protein JWO85_3224 [Candidatus Eremiobacteraeota bacterium]|nr:hypothetical protein [Candidatus Eremiobacteraeota bacterium]
MNLFWQIPDGVAIAHGHFPQRVETAIESGPLVAQEWLFEVAVGWLATHGLYPLVVVGCALAGAATPLLVYALARTGGCGTLAAGVVAFLAAGSRLAAAAVRPETLAVDAFALELLVLAGRASVWWIFPVVLLWANVHASVPLGVIAPVLVSAGTLVTSGARSTAFRRAAAASALALGATLATPHGVGLWVYAWQLAIAPNPVTAQLEAWRSLSLMSPAGVLTVIPGLAVLIAVGAVIRRRTVPELLVAGVVLAATIVHARAAVFLPVAWALPLARALDERTHIGALARAAPRAPLLALIPFCAFFALSAPAIQPAPDRDGPWRSAAAIAADHHLAGNTYTDYGWAAYLTYRGLPLRPLIDGHGDPYPPSVWADAAALEHLAPNWDEVLRRRSIRVVIVAAQAPIAQALALRTDWVLVERRRGVIAYVRR